MILSDQLSERIQILKAKEPTAVCERDNNLRNEIIRRIRKENPGMNAGRIYALSFAEYLEKKAIPMPPFRGVRGHHTGPKRKAERA